MKLSVVIPCYNERATIEAVVDAVRAAPVEDIEIILLKRNLMAGSTRSCCRNAIAEREQLCAPVFKQLPATP